MSRRFRASAWLRFGADQPSQRATVTATEVSVVIGRQVRWRQICPYTSILTPAAAQSLASKPRLAAVSLVLDLDFAIMAPQS